MALSLLAWAVIAVAALTSVSIAMSVKQKKDMEDAQAGLLIQKQGGTHPIPIVYGERRIAPTKVWEDISKQRLPVSSPSQSADSFFTHNNESSYPSSRDDEDFLHRIDVWCQGPIESISNIEIDDDPVNTHKRFTQVKNNRPLFRGLNKHGSDSQTMFSELRNGFSSITSSMKGNGLAWSWNSFMYTADKPQYYGDPKLTAKIRGIKVWDPRDNPSDSSVKSWSDNPSLILLDYLTASYGKGLTLNDLDIDSFINAANECDIVVSLPPQNPETEGRFIYNPATGEYEYIEVNDYNPNGNSETSQKRFTCNIAIQPNVDSKENVTEILKTFKGSLPFINGKYVLSMEVIASSVMSFDDTNILDGVSISYGDRANRFNQVTVKFPNKLKGHKEDAVTWPATTNPLYNTLLNEDSGEKLTTEATLSGVTSYSQAEDLAEFMVRDSRNQQMITFKTQPVAMRLEPNDIITVTTGALNYTAQPYRVREVKIGTDLIVEITAQEYDPTVYPWYEGDPEPAPEYVESNLFSTPNLMQNVNATGVTLTNADTTANTNIVVTWDPIVSGTAPVDVIQIGYKLQSAVEYAWHVLPAGQVEATLVGLQDNSNYLIIARYRNQVGNTSDDVTLTVTTPNANTNIDTDIAGAASDAADAASDAADAASDAADAASDAADAASDAANAADAAANAQTAADNAQNSIDTLDLSSFAITSDLADFITQVEVDAAQSAAEAYADGVVPDLSGIDFSTFLVSSDVTDFITQAEATAAQTAAESYADGLVVNLQSAQDVADAIANDTTVIDGSRITTGTIDAARISISGLNASALNNDAFATSDDIPDVSGFQTASDVADAVSAIDLSAYALDSDLAGYVTTVQGTALQGAAESYADGLVSGLQTAADVSAAIAADTTVIDGSRITTGTIDAARISISGLNASALTNDAFATTDDIPDVSDFQTATDVSNAQTAAQSYADGLVSGLQTAADVSAAIAADTTVIDGARITTGTIDAGRISISGLDISDLNDDLGYALATSIPDVSLFQTAAEVSAAITADTTVIDGSRITTGTVDAARISISGLNASELNNDVFATTDDISGFQTSSDVADAVSAIDLSVYALNSDLSGYITTVQGTALQGAAESYADGLVTGLQTAADVSTALANDTTVIDGSRITTGTIDAARISISGLDASTLNNDAFATTDDIPDVSDFATSSDLTALETAAQGYADGLVVGLQTAADVSAALASDTTVIDGSRITTGTIDAGRISISGLDISDLNDDLGYALSTEIPDVTPFQTAGEVAAALAADTTVIDGSRITTGVIDAARVSSGSLVGGSIPDANAAPSNSEQGSFFDLDDGKFVVGNASSYIYWNGYVLDIAGVTPLSDFLTVYTSVSHNSAAPTTPPNISVTFASNGSSTYTAPSGWSFSQPTGVDDDYYRSSALASSLGAGTVSASWSTPEKYREGQETTWELNVPSILALSYGSGSDTSSSPPNRVVTATAQPSSGTAETCTLTCYMDTGSFSSRNLSHVNVIVGSDANGTFSVSNITFTYLGVSMRRINFDVSNSTSGLTQGAQFFISTNL